MPTLANVASALRRYKGRYECLDVFADDVDELASAGARLLADAGLSGATIVTSAVRLRVQLFPEKGIARFRLAEPAGDGEDRTAANAALGAFTSAVSKVKDGLLGGLPDAALVETAVSAASKVKEGLLGGLIVGMLVGGAKGADARPIERVLALKFDPEAGDWQVYDGPLLRWAKRTLQPAVAAA